MRGESIPSSVQNVLIPKPAQHRCHFAKLWTTKFQLQLYSYHQLCAYRYDKEEVRRVTELLLVEFCNACFERVFELSDCRYGKHSYGLRVADVEEDNGDEDGWNNGVEDDIDVVACDLFGGSDDVVEDEVFGDGNVDEERKI
ncbi:hypothetical protein BP5796_09352 [Coleophoma crateriformis]|uniref:Uncharacterized protein n=1 Tax=Coleophoma crateriformis TaxID=565419 RepID=A0A3D8QXP8_9HELO|nr:hypothetical protein BP5796_09352 [Coleophoma crateriformis]